MNFQSASGPGNTITYKQIVQKEEATTDENLLSSFSLVSFHLFSDSLSKRFSISLQMLFATIMKLGISSEHVLFLDRRQTRSRSKQRATEFSDEDIVNLIVGLLGIGFKEHEKRRQHDGVVGMTNHGLAREIKPTAHEYVCGTSRIGATIYFFGGNPIFTVCLPWPVPSQTVEDLLAHNPIAYTIRHRNPHAINGSRPR